MTQQRPPWQPYLDDTVSRLAALRTRIPADRPTTSLGAFSEISDVERHQAQINFDLQYAIELLVTIVDQLHRDVEDFQQRSNQ